MKTFKELISSMRTLDEGAFADRRKEIEGGAKIDAPGTTVTELARAATEDYNKLYTGKALTLPEHLDAYGMSSMAAMAHTIAVSSLPKHDKKGKNMHKEAAENHYRLGLMHRSKLFKGK